MKLATALLALCFSLASTQGVDYEHLPTDTVFPGPWEQNIKAPKDKTRILPAKVFFQESVKNPESVLENTQVNATAASNGRFNIGLGGTVIYEFAENIGGRYATTTTPTNIVPH